MLQAPIVPCPHKSTSTFGENHLIEQLELSKLIKETSERPILVATFLSSLSSLKLSVSNIVIAARFPPNSELLKTDKKKRLN